MYMYVCIYKREEGWAEEDVACAFACGRYGSVPELGSLKLSQLQASFGEYIISSRFSIGKIRTQAYL